MLKTLQMQNMTDPDAGFELHVEVNENGDYVSSTVVEVGRQATVEVVPLDEVFREVGFYNPGGFGGLTL